MKNRRLVALCALLFVASLAFLALTRSPSHRDGASAGSAPAQSPLPGRVNNKPNSAPPSAPPADASLGAAVVTPDRFASAVTPSSTHGGATPDDQTRPSPAALSTVLARRLEEAATPAELLRDADLSIPEIRAFVVARMSEM